MKNIAKTITLLHKLRGINNTRLRGLNTRIEELKIEQRIRHQRIMRCSEENLEKDLKTYLFNNNSLHLYEEVFDKIQEINQEKMMIVKLLIKYSNMPEANSIVINTEKYMSREDKIKILYSIFNDMEEDKNYEYVKMIRNKINTLEKNSLLPTELN